MGLPTTSATGRSARRRGFTLLEVLLVLGLLGLLAGLFIANVGRVLQAEAVSAEEVFWTAVTEARRYALLHAEDVQLAFDSKEKAFTAATREGSRTFPVPYPGELKIDFLAANPSGRATILLGGTLVETQPLPFVTFYADGTCSAFRAQIRTGGEPRFIAIDPWTCAPVLAATPAR
jgi:prepilin-type N-terminal cleavage/methylation domain-containing protein